jgi:hypothetical protein
MTIRADANEAMVGLGFRRAVVAPGSNQLLMAVRSDGAEQLLEVDGLLEVLIGMDPLSALLAIVCGRHADHGHVRVAGIGKLALTEFIPRHDRHHQVEQNHRRAALIETAERLGTVARRRDIEPFPLEKDREHLAQIHVVLNDENRRRTRHDHV